jgi:hypothetical protein
LQIRIRRLSSSPVNGPRSNVCLERSRRQISNPRVTTRHWPSNSNEPTCSYFCEWTSIGLTLAMCEHLKNLGLKWKTIMSDTKADPNGLGTWYDSLTGKLKETLEKYRKYMSIRTVPINIGVFHALAGHQRPKVQFAHNRGSRGEQKGRVRIRLNEEKSRLQLSCFNTL